jgi:hypothetical protein
MVYDNIFVYFSNKVRLPKYQKPPLALHKMTIWLHFWIKTAIFGQKGVFADQRLEDSETS